MGLLDVVRAGLRVGTELWAEVKPDPCPIPWRPNALAPVFYGYHHISPELVVFDYWLPASRPARAGVARAPPTSWRRIS